jgi:AraC-like DNA-binding protein
MDAIGQPDSRRTGDGPLVQSGLAHLVEIDDGLAVGLTRLPRTAPQWPQPMEIGGDHHVVFNYVTEEVDFERVGPTMLTPNELVLCPAGSVYRRLQTRSPEEINVFVAASTDFSEQLGCTALTEKAVPKLVHASDRLSLEAWRLAHELRHTQAGHRHDLEYAERATVLLAPLRSTASANSGLGSTRPARQQHQALVDATREHLASSFADQGLTLAQLAHDVGAGAFHLARVFRRLTGLSLHEYRTQLRLRAALLALPESDSLADLAVSVGFSSHSHLSDMFRRHFEVSPSQLRAVLRAGTT